MSLKGNIKILPLPELLRFLALRKSTGTLELTRQNDWKRVYFERGKIISCGASDPKEYLGHFLISENKITEEQLTEAMEVQKKTKVMLGKILVMIGAVTEEELLYLLEVKARESIMNAFFWDEAEFEFYDNQLPAVRLIPLSLEVESVVEAGIRRMEEWNHLRQQYPTGQIRLAKNPDNLGDASLEDTFSKKMYDLVDGERTIDDILMTTHSGVFRVLHTIESLRSRNLIAVAGCKEEKDDAPVSGIPYAQLIEMGKNKLAFGRFEEAINLFSYVQRHDQQNTEVSDLLARAENGLLQNIYETAIPPGAIPRLSRPLEELADEKLTSEESFLVTRINGRWDVKSILTITPLREVDAVRMLKRLIDRKIVSV